MWADRDSPRKIFFVSNSFSGLSSVFSIQLEHSRAVPLQTYIRVSFIQRIQYSTWHGVYGFRIREYIITGMTETDTCNASATNCPLKDLQSTLCFAHWNFMNFQQRFKDQTNLSEGMIAVDGVIAISSQPRPQWVWATRFRICALCGLTCRLRSICCQFGRNAVRRRGSGCRRSERSRVMSSRGNALNDSNGFFEYGVLVVLIGECNKYWLCSTLCSWYKTEDEPLLLFFPGTETYTVYFHWTSLSTLVTWSLYWMDVCCT